MGAYLSQPITDKLTEVGENATLEFSVSAMQGWRTEMEDAHVCALDVEHRTSFFGVFDGHGGKEVAQFVALHIVEEFCNSNGFSTANITIGLKEAYLSLDARIRSDNSRSELLKLGSMQKTEEEKSLERVINMSHLPKSLREAITASRRIQSGSDSESASDGSEFGSDNDEDTSSTTSSQDCKVDSFPIFLSDSSSSSESDNEESAVEEQPSEQPIEDSNLPPTEPTCEPNVSLIEGTEQGEKATVLFNTSDSTGSTECRSSDETGTVAVEDATNSPVSASPPSAKVELSQSSHNDKTMKTLSNDCLLGDTPPSAFIQQAKTRSGRRQGSVLSGFLPFVCPFLCLRSPTDLPNEDPIVQSLSSSSSISATALSTPSPMAKEADKKEKQLEWYRFHPAELIETDSPPSENERPSVDHIIHDDTQLINEIIDEVEPVEINHPDDDDNNDDDCNGRDVTVAGCTAVVAVIKGETLFVANAGDSRCVLCHDGIALPMSRDHKPTDPEEYARIKRAGGFVSDGRVNGCLNLSRALGDMEYKKSPNLAPEEYMITANPDIKTVDLQSGDHFLILACDGIWDVLSDQEACDFVLTRLEQNHSLASISSELCDFCLADNADGSGEGCDNMTAMIILLKDTASNIDNSS